MFVEAVCMPRGWIVYTCVHGGDWNTESHDLEGIGTPESHDMEGIG
ncbi:unnamed protein product, partial [Staurois parvus]